MPEVPVEMTDSDMVTLALKDKVFFGHIVTRYEAKLRRYLMRLGVHSVEDQDDILQEIFIKVYKNLNSFDTSLKFSSWIYRIAHNEAVSWFRKKSVRPEGHLVAEGDSILELITSKETGAEELFDSRINATVVLAALKNLDQKYRDPLILRFFEHKEYEEISDILQIPIGSVGTLIHRGKNQLAKEIDTNHIRL